MALFIREGQCYDGKSYFAILTTAKISLAQIYASATKGLRCRRAVQCTGCSGSTILLDTALQRNVDFVAISDLYGDKR